MILKGIRWRAVSCVDRIVGELLYEERCQESKPMTEKMCYESPSCENHLPQLQGREQEMGGQTFGWTAGAWGQVSMGGDDQ